MRRQRRQMPPMLSHQWIDMVDLAMHRAMARRIRRQPELYDRARRTLARWERVKRACPAPLREWKDILRSKDREIVLKIITRADEEGDRLRQSSPFCDILTTRERDAIWAHYDQK